MLVGAVSADVSADWDDAEAAVEVALLKTELVKVRLDRSDPVRLIYTLRTSRDAPATLTIDRVADLGDADPVLLRVSCSIGRFGDADRERELVVLVIHRLAQLRGVEVAPVP